MNYQIIEDLAIVVRGSSPRPKGDPRYYGGEIPRLMVSDVSRDGMYVTPKIDSLTTEGAKKSRSMLKGDVVLAVSGDPGEPSILEVDACIHDGFVGLRELNKKLVNTEYLYHFLKFSKNNNRDSAVGAIYKNLNTTQIKNLQIPLPPIKTQQKIAAILDEADKLRQLDKKLIKKYEDLSQSLFLEMFGDIIKNPRNFQEYKLGNVCDEIFLGLTSKVEYVDNGGYPLIRAKDIRYGELKFDKVKFISKKQHERITKNRITKRGDVLISKSGSLGTCAIVNSDREFTTYESIFTVRVDQVYLTNIFLTELLRNESFKMKLLGNKVGGTVAHLNLKMFRDFIIPVPPISLQNEFALKIQLINEEKLMVKSLTRKSNKLFNSLLQKAFKGELV